MQDLIVRNGEIFIAIFAAFLALIGAAAHIADPIERAGSAQFGSLEPGPRR